MNESWVCDLKWIKLRIVSTFIFFMLGLYKYTLGIKLGLNMATKTMSKVTAPIVEGTKSAAKATAKVAGDIVKGTAKAAGNIVKGTAKIASSGIKKTKDAVVSAKRASCATVRKNPCWTAFIVVFLAGVAGTLAWMIYGKRIMQSDTIKRVTSWMNRKTDKLFKKTRGVESIESTTEVDSSVPSVTSTKMTNPASTEKSSKRKTLREASTQPPNTPAAETTRIRDAFE